MSSGQEDKFKTELFFGESSQPHENEPAPVDKLLPCPFCGGNKIEQDYSEYDNTIDYWIECVDCEIVLSRDTKRQAIHDWNMRRK